MLHEDEQLDSTPEQRPAPEEERAYTPPPPPSPVRGIEEAVTSVKGQIGKVVVGQQEYIELMLATLFVGGHVLVEGVPGIAKTLTAKLLAQTLDVGFARIQFTPDLMPSDVLGTMVFNAAETRFDFNAGPIFSNVVLIDEINRSPAKTQAALFEVMEEYQVTIDGTSYPMTQPFFVLATQNPIEQEGTYKLPEAQLDRFLVKIDINYPDLDDEKAILRRFRDDFRIQPKYDIEPVMTAERIEACRRVIESVVIRDELLDYIARIVHDTRQHPDLYLGASPRASLALLKLSKAIAAINGRDFVIPDDIQYIAYPVLNHRVILTPEREMEGYTTRDVIESIIKKLDVPR